MLKLSKLNLGPKILTWIREFLTSCSQFLTVNGHNSYPLAVTSGMPQGSVLGPLLFLIYINDLPLHASSNIHMFADDCVIYCTITNTSAQVALQDDINNVLHWCNHWLMTLSPNKRKSLSSHCRRSPFTYSYQMGNVALENVITYKYLGVTLSNDLSWHAHITNIISLANRWLGFLKLHLHHAPLHVKLLAYKSLIRTHLEYDVVYLEPSSSILNRHTGICPESSS